MPSSHREKAGKKLKGKVRLADESDIEQIAKVVNVTNKALYKDIIPPEKLRDPFITLEKLTKDFQKWHFFVYENKRRVIGTAALEESDSETGNVYRLYVLPKFQRQGVGSALMQEVEHKAKELGLKRLKLRVYLKAHWAVSFYQKIGYSKAGEIDYQWGRDCIFQKNL